MIDPCDAVIRSLEGHPSRLNKEAIIEAQIDNTELFEGFELALSPYITFGVKKVPSFSGPDGQGLPWEAFKELCHLLSTRQLTGDDARSAIELALMASKKSQWNDWYRRILIKDLRCGTSEKTINKVVEKKWPQYAVPVFSCQLAHDSANHEGKVTGKKYIEVKLDGVRVITIVRADGRVDMFSRNGKELVNFPHIVEQISNVIKKHGTTKNVDFVLDGEVMSSSFQDLMKQVHRKSNVKANDAVLWLFDALPLKDFEQGVCKITQKDRSDWLNTWYNSKLAKSMANVACLDHAVVDLDTDEGQKLYSMYNKSAIENGYEGIMIKDLDAPYECKRSHAWLKQKPFIEVSLEVRDVEEGTGRNLGRLGALVAAGIDDGRSIQVNVGSGFSDSARTEFWLARDSVIGKIIEVRADAVTQNQDGSYSLRFPRFLRFRGFEVGEKI